MAKLGKDVRFHRCNPRAKLDESIPLFWKLPPQISLSRDHGVDGILMLHPVNAKMTFLIRLDRAGAVKSPDALEKGKTASYTV